MKTYFHIFQHPVFDAIGSALLHSLWQGAVVAGLLFLALKVIRKEASELRYALAGTALLVMALLPVATAVQLYVSNPAPIDFDAVQSMNKAEPVGREVVAAEPALVVSQETVAIEAQSPGYPWRPVVVTLWLGGILFMLFKWVRGTMNAHQLRSSGVPVYKKELEAAFVAIKNRLGITKQVRLCSSLHVDQPMMIGWFKPVVLLPMSMLTAMPPEQVEAILTHELAHVRRHDYLVLMLQTAAETLFFYHPAIWWVSKCMNVEREYCCDKMATDIIGNDLVYASALVNLTQTGSSGAHALGASDGRLVDRIRRIADRDGQVTRIRKRHVSIWGAGITVIGCMLLLAACLQGVDAQEDDPLEALYMAAVEEMDQRNFMAAKELAEQAANEGHLCSCELLAEMYDARKGRVGEVDGVQYVPISWGEENDSLSIYWANKYKESLENRANEGDSRAMIWMSFAHSGGWVDKKFEAFEESDSLSNVWLERALQANSPYAWRIKARNLIREGQVEEADRHFEKAVELGDEGAFFWWMRSDTATVSQPDPRRYFSIAERAIELKAPGIRADLSSTLDGLKKQVNLGNEYAMAWMAIADSLNISERIQSLPESGAPRLFPAITMCEYNRDWFYDPAPGY